MIQFILSVILASLATSVLVFDKKTRVSTRIPGETTSLIMSGASPSYAIVSAGEAPEGLVSKVLRGVPPSELDITDPSLRVAVRLSESSREAPQEAMPQFGELITEFETERMKIVETFKSMQQRGMIMSFVLGAISPLLARLGPSLVSLNSSSASVEVQLWAAMMVLATAAGCIDLPSRTKVVFLLYLVSEVLLSSYITGFVAT